MNAHFLSFLLDVASWLTAGFIYGKLIARFDKLNRGSSNIASIKMAFVSLLGGLIATAERALPDQGFAVYHFTIAMTYSFLYSLKYFGKFRRFTFRKINYGIRVILNSPLFKRAPSYK